MYDINCTEKVNVIGHFLPDILAEQNINLLYVKPLVCATWHTRLASARKLRVQIGSYWIRLTLQALILLACARETVGQAARTSGLMYSKMIICWPNSYYFNLC